MGKGTVFISYARQDKEWAKWLGERLHGHGFEISTDMTSVAPGQSWIKELDRAIANADVLLAVLSPNYFQSTWCQQETAAAVANGVPIVPVLVEPCEIQGFLRHYHLADLTANRDRGLRAVIQAAEELPAHRPV